MHFYQQWVWLYIKTRRKMNDMGGGRKRALIELLKEIENEQVDYELPADERFVLTVNEEEDMFDLEEFYSLCFSV